MNINSADLEELQKLPGVGEQVAQSIIDNRPYDKPEDLLQVKRVGEKLLEDILPFIENRCTHVNLQSYSTNGVKDNLQCVLQAGHKGDHQSPHIERDRYGELVERLACWKDEAGNYKGVNDANK